MTSKTTNKFSPEVRGRAVRIVLDHGADHSSRWTACQSISAKIGCSAHMLLDWVKKAEIDAGKRQRRHQLLENAVRLRSGLRDVGCDVFGAPSAIVPVKLGDTYFSRLMTPAAADEGAIVNLVEFPAVARNACGWRLQVMADHQAHHIEQLVKAAVSARAWTHKVLHHIRVAISLIAAR